MPGEPVRFEALVARFMKLGSADRRAVLENLSPGERDLFERELATARQDQRSERARVRLADRQFVGYSPWLAALIGSAARDDGGSDRPLTEACSKAIVLVHRAVTEQAPGEGPFRQFLRQLGISGFAAGVDEPR